MPPKRIRSVVQIKPSEYVLPCEWLVCTSSFTDMEKFIQHLNNHLSEYLGNMSLQTTDAQDFICQWRECGSEVEGETTGYLRHVYFHAFHVKIKCIGALLTQKSEIDNCSLDSQSRNLIPELPEQLQCRWEDCGVTYENADIFYRHVESHTDSIPDGNDIPGGCTCNWEGCGLNVKNKYKMREHLRSHTQEKVVACPTCGGLFSSRTKFFDHLSRQTAGTAGKTSSTPHVTNKGANRPGHLCQRNGRQHTTTSLFTNVHPIRGGKRYQCSHCNKVFAAERLLRDHMRNHVNQYKCPYCDMTCPAPSCLRQHLKYRHSKDKPYKCDMCDYSGKSMADLRKHQDTHSADASFHCQVSECEYTARGYQSLANHFKKVHQALNVANYMCHVCNSQFTRGAVLTKHLKKKHKFNWPSGHSRFRYKMHTDGFWRLQTVRYESIELSASAEAGQKDSDDSCQSVPAVNPDDNSVAMDENDDDEENIDINIQQTKHTEGTDKGQKSIDNDNYVVAEKSNETVDQSDAEVTEITLTTDSDGRYIITTNQNFPEGESACITMPQSKEFEDSMYNLQMLGDVALKNQTENGGIK